MNTIADVTDANSLYEAFRQSKKGVSWKASVQRYEMNMLRNIRDSKKTLDAGESPVLGFTEFTLHERGKVRHVKSVHIKERVVQRSLCDNAVVPLLSKGLEYDNSASQKGKGLHFTISRLDAHLHQYYRREGTNEGYILLVDFKSYYDNVRHDKVYERMERKIPDPGIKHLARQLIEPFDDGTGKSLGIGSQISQITAIDYPSELDHIIKHDLKIKEFARYMDDSYLIHRSKEYLHYCLDAIKAKCDEIGIIVNIKKTQIVKLSHGFTFLKLRWLLTDTGKVVKRTSKDSITRERRKLTKFKTMLDEGRITMDVVANQYRTWRGGKEDIQAKHGRPKIHFDNYYILRRMDAYYNTLFIDYLKNGGAEYAAAVHDRESDCRQEADARRYRLPGDQICGGPSDRRRVCRNKVPARNVAGRNQPAGSRAG